MTNGVDAYPLAWPEGWPRTPPEQIKDARFNFRRSFSSGGGSKFRYGGI